MVYLLPCIGGYIGDHVLGTKRTIVLGAITLSIGYFLLSIPNIMYHHIFWALATIAVGNGLFKANPSSLLAKAYQGKKQYNMDSGFTLYYMAINIGAFVSMSLTPFLGAYFGWAIAYGVCFVGLLISLFNFILMRKRVQDIGSKPDFEPISLRNLALVILGSALTVSLCAYLLKNHSLTTLLLMVGTVIYFSVYFLPY